MASGFQNRERTSTSSVPVSKALYDIASLSNASSRAALVVGILASLVFYPLAAVQGALTRRRTPRLLPAKPPHQGLVPGAGPPIRVLAIGDSTVAGVGLKHGGEAVAAQAARRLHLLTGRSVAWHANGLSGATVRDAIKHLLPGLIAKPIDLLIVAFGVNDVVAYRSPATFADDLAELVTVARSRVGEAAVVIAGVAPLAFFPALPWPLRIILNWRAAALQRAAEQLTERVPRIVVERFAMSFEPHLFAEDRFHPNFQAHVIWGDEIAGLALPLLIYPNQRTERNSPRLDATFVVTPRDSASATV